MTRSRSRRDRRVLRRRDRFALLVVILVAVAAGIVAGSLGSPQPWQTESTSVSE